MSKFVGTDVLPTVATLPVSGVGGQIIYHSTSGQYYSWNTTSSTWQVLGAGGSTSAGRPFLFGE